jgi:hypothetical protein
MSLANAKMSPANEELRECRGPGRAQLKAGEKNLRRAREQIIRNQANHGARCGGVDRLCDAANRPRDAEASIGVLEKLVLRQWARSDPVSYSWLVS